jgi:hypothetical protein
MGPLERSNRMDWEYLHNKGFTKRTYWFRMQLDDGTKQTRNGPVRVGAAVESKIRLSWCEGGGGHMEEVCFVTLDYTIINSPHPL